MIPAITRERLRVRYAETDMMGHVYYANYLVWFEQARATMFREAGRPYGEIEAAGYKLPVVEAWCKYKGEAKYDDEIEVRAWVSERKRASIKVSYEVENVTRGGIITEGYTWHVVVDREFKVVSIPSIIGDLIAP